MSWLLRTVKHALASALRRAADELERPAPTLPAAPAQVPAEADPEGDAADRLRLFDAMEVRLGQVRFEQYLRKALRRYHPEDKPAEA